MERKIKSLAAAILVLLDPTGVARAARSCANATAPAPVKWTVSEWTYDGPDKTARGRAAIDAAVGLYLTAGGNDYSCFGSWPESWAGRTKGAGGGSLIWFPCVLSRGRALDETVSFAVDWEDRTLHAAHMFRCADGPDQG